jgi:DNA-binding transcriptional ArsR family regulator
MEERIVLDRESFKALAVDTRVSIMKTLGTRRHTQSELAADLKLSVPTIKEHLDALAKAGLVERQDDGHKWVYYALTRKGKAVVNPEEKKFWIALSVLVLTVVGGFAGFIKQQFGSLYSQGFSSVSGSMKEAAPLMAEARVAAAPTAADTAAGSLAAAPQAAPVAAATSQIPWGWIIIIAIFAIEIGIVTYFWYKGRQHRKELLKHLN